jgi:hypothetical protein
MPHGLTQSRTGPHVSQQVQPIARLVVLRRRRGGRGRRSENCRVTLWRFRRGRPPERDASQSNVQRSSSSLAATTCLWSPPGRVSLLAAGLSNCLKRWRPLSSPPSRLLLLHVEVKRYRAHSAIAVDLTPRGIAGWSVHDEQFFSRTSEIQSDPPAGSAFG